MKEGNVKKSRPQKAKDILIQKKLMCAKKEVFHLYVEKSPFEIFLFL
jgi:hypothetical protein